jgi:hypothetical protein
MKEKITNILLVILFTMISWTVSHAQALNDANTTLNVTCHGGSDGSIDLTVTGGVLPYTYNWSNGSTTEDISELSAGDYTVTITDNAASSLTTIISITQPSPIEISTTSTNVSCNGGSDGSINVQATGGSGYLQTMIFQGSVDQVTPAAIPTVDCTSFCSTCTGICFSAFGRCWCVTIRSGPGTPLPTPTPASLVAGTYSILTMDSINGCYKLDSVVITQPSPIVISTTSTNVSCNGGSDGSINVQATGGSGYLQTMIFQGSIDQVTPAAIPTVDCTSFCSTCTGNCFRVFGRCLCVTIRSGPGTPLPTPTPASLVAGTYSILTMDSINGCYKLDSVVITQPSPIVISTTSTNVSCNGGSDGSINVQATGGSGYLQTMIFQGSVDQVTPAAIPTVDCTSFCSTCTGICFSAFGRCWCVTIRSGPGTPLPTPTPASLVAGTYSILTMDSINGCYKLDSVVITQPSPIIISTTSTNISCNGGIDGSIALTTSGGTGPYSYAWSNGATTQNITGLSAGVFSVFVSDGNGCSTNTSDTISEPSALELHLDTIHNPPTQISNGLINITTLGGTPPYNYSWNGPNGFTSTSEDISGLFAGNYIVTFTDANGCSAIETIVLEAAFPPILGTYPDETLILGGNTTVTPNTAPINTLSTVAYTNTNFTGSLTVDPLTGIVTVTDAKQAGTYSITITGFGNGGLTASATFTLNVVNGPCSNGLFTNAADALVAAQPYSVAIGDFNNDGHQDMAVAIPADNSVSIRMGDGSGSFTGNTNVPVGSDPRWVSIGDFNGDGIADIATANTEGNSVSVRLGNGSGDFTGTTELLVGLAPYCVVTGDFNGDGKIDLAAVNTDGYDVSILIGDGAGNFSGNTQVPVGILPFAAAIGDYNNDGKQDLAVANGGSGTISIHLGDGLGNFSSGLDITVGTTTNVQLGDFNNDGNQDLVATNQNDNNISILNGDGTGNFIVTSTLATGIQPWSSAIGDFNGDGRQDIVTANYHGDVSEWFGDGAGNFVTGTTVTVINNPYSIAVGDFNNDSIQDFAVADFGNTTVSVRLGLSVPIGAEINLVGNGSNIIDGDITPDVADETNFGNVNVGGNSIHTYTIQNTETTELTVNGISMTGVNASLFSTGVLTPSSPIAANSSATFTVTFSPISTGVKTATVHIANDDCNESDYDFAVQGTGGSAYVILNQNILLQGFYLGEGMMSNCLNITGVSAESLDADTIFVSAMSPVSPYIEVDRQPGILKSNGDVAVTFSSAVIANNLYYLKINHRNSIETWSANPVLLTETTNYSFSSATSQAFLSNQAVTFDALYAAIFSGDINQDGAVDGSDFLELDPSIQNGDGGYAVGDLNGDGAVDGTDFLVMDPNIQNGVGASIP